MPNWKKFKFFYITIRHKTYSGFFFSFFIFKERWGYICPDIAKEFAKYEAEPAKWIKKYESVNAITKKVANFIFYYVAFIGNWLRI